MKFLVDLAFRHTSLLFEDLAALVAGLLPAKDVEPFMKTILGRNAIRLATAARDPEAVRRIIEMGSADTLLELSPHVAYYCPDPKAWPEILCRLAEIDPTNEMTV